MKSVNGFQFEKMIRNGLANLLNAEDEINMLNVFPVADGDTGNNMCATVSHGISNAGMVEALNEYLKKLSYGMLFGARGNSGVILSQIFSGISSALSQAEEADAILFRDALINGYKVAYESVTNPTEGTILTVARLGIENIADSIDADTSLELLLAKYVEEMRKILAQTPQMLPVLKESGVVDSGAMGYIVLVEGMLKYIYGEFIKSVSTGESRGYAVADIDSSLFNEDSVFVDGYCMEFLLQRMNGAAYCKDFEQKTFTERLGRLGSSLVSIQDGMRIKVHIHTRKPEDIIAYCRQYGEFLNFKLENMQLQHNETDRIKQENTDYKKFAIVAAADGEGLKEIFKGLGCDYVIECSTSMNTSAQEFADALEKVKAEEVVILPNNKNAVSSAEQAVRLLGRTNITVIPTANMVEGYYCLAMDITDGENIRQRIEAMKASAGEIEALAQTRAVKEYSGGDVIVHKGDEILLHDKDIIYAGSDDIEAVCEGIASLGDDILDRECMMIFRGCDADEAGGERLCSAISEHFPGFEINVLEGGQSMYRWLIGIF